MQNIKDICRLFGTFFFVFFLNEVCVPAAKPGDRDRFATSSSDSDELEEDSSWRDRNLTYHIYITLLQVRKAIKLSVHEKLSQLKDKFFILRS